jgi:hypothetical protein
LLEPIESSEGLEVGTDSFSSGTGVGGLLKTRPFFKFRADAMCAEYGGTLYASSSSAAVKSSSSEDSPSKPANRLLDLNGRLMLTSISLAKGPLSLFPG